MKSLGELKELLQGLEIEDSNNDGGEGSESINAAEETKQSARTLQSST